MRTIGGLIVANILTGREKAAIGDYRTLFSALRLLQACLSEAYESELQQDRRCTSLSAEFMEVALLLMNEEDAGAQKYRDLQQSEIYKQLKGKKGVLSIITAQGRKDKTIGDYYTLSAFIEAMEHALKDRFSAETAYVEDGKTGEEIAIVENEFFQIVLREQTNTKSNTNQFQTL